jgi:hypothetical protein
MTVKNVFVKRWITWLCVTTMLATAFVSASMSFAQG